MILCEGGSGPRDLIIVRLDEKPDSREAQMATGSIVGGHGGFDPKKTTIAPLVKRDDGTWEFSPEKDLAPGDYLITTGTQPHGFDFAIQAGAR